MSAVGGGNLSPLLMPDVRWSHHVICIYGNAATKRTAVHVGDRSKQVIRDAIMDNNFLKNLDATQVREIVDCVYERKVKTGQFVIKEGDPGQHFYVAAGR